MPRKFVVTTSRVTATYDDNNELVEIPQGNVTDVQHQWTLSDGSCVIVYNDRQVTLAKGVWSYLDELSPGVFEETGQIGRGAYGRVAGVRYGASHFARKRVKASEFNYADWSAKSQFWSTSFDCNPHAVKFIKTWQVDHEYVILMAPRADRDLKAHLKLRQKQVDREAAFDPYTKQLFRWMGCLARTLSGTHRSGITPVVHGDIKPANILVQGDNVLYADYGVAGTRTHSIKPGFTSKGGSVELSPVRPSPSEIACLCGCALEVDRILQHVGYKPPFTPEEEEDDRLSGLGGQSGDVFSLGWVVYEMLLVTAPEPLDRYKLPCRLKAKQFAWNNMTAFVECVDEICQNRVDASVALGKEYERYTRLTNALLKIVMDCMIVFRNDGRSDSYDVACRFDKVLGWRGCVADESCNKLTISGLSGTSLGGSIANYDQLTHMPHVPAVGKMYHGDLFFP